MALDTSDIEKTASERVVDPRSKKDMVNTAHKWELAESDADLMQQLLSTVEFLKKTNAYRIRQASVFSRLLSGKPLTNYFQSNSSLDSSNQLPIGRPTANIVFSCTDTTVSRISKDKPKAEFLTDGGNYRSQKLAKEANKFAQGEFYRTEAYALMADMTRDACCIGDGLLKVLAKGRQVCVERVLATELLVDYNDAYYGKPRKLYHLKLVDRSEMLKLLPEKSGIIMSAVHGNVDSTPRSAETVADQFIVAEAWCLPSGEDSGDGRHVWVCTSGILLDEKWEHDDFPFVKLAYSKTNLTGWFSQSLAEILMPTQMEIYRMLIVASQAIELMGVPRIYIDEMSKIVETSFNNKIGTIIKGRGPNPPTFLNAISNPPEIYQWIQWLIQNGYQMSGISQMSAAGVKPSGVDSGEAIREFDGIQDDRFAALAKRYQDVVPALTYKMIDCAAEIAEKHGSYETVYPGKDGLSKIDFKAIQKLRDNYVIQCYEESSLPQDPVGRQSRLSEMLASGEVTLAEFRRLSTFPDLEQSDNLANALEDRIIHALDQIVDQGAKDYASIAPDAFLLDGSNLAETIAVQYINRYSTLDLEEDKMQLLRDWLTQVQGLKNQALSAAQPPMPAQGPQPPQGAPQGVAGQLPPTAPPLAPQGPASNVQV